MQLYRVLFAWEGRDRPYPPNTIVELDPDDPGTRSFVQMGGVEAVDAETAALYGGPPVAAEDGAETALPAQDHSALADLLTRNGTTVVAYVENIEDPVELDALKQLEEARDKGARRDVAKAIAARRQVFRLEAQRPVVEAMQARDAEIADAAPGREPEDYLTSLAREQLIEAAVLFEVSVAEDFDFADADQRVGLMGEIGEAAAEAAALLSAPGD